VASDTSFTNSASHTGQVRTFLIADVRGYTRFTRDSGDEAAAALAMRFASLSRAVVAEWDGEVLGLRGDELAAAFASPRQALQAAIALQQRFADERRADPALPLLVGIGLDAGESVAVEDGYRGGALNLAARLCSIAKAGEVLVSDTVEHLAGRQRGVSFVDAGRHRVKGLADRVHVFRAVFPLDMPELPVTRTARRTPIRVAAIALVCVMALAVADLWVTTRGGTPAAVGVVVRANSLVKIDVKSRRVVADVRLGAQPGEVVSGDGGVWVADDQHTEVLRVDATTLTVDRQGVPIDPARLAFGSHTLWVYDPLDSSVAEVDPDLTQNVLPTLIPLPKCLTKQSLRIIGGRYGCRLGGIAVADDGSVWIGRQAAGGAIWKLDPTSASPTATLTVRDAVAARLASGGGSIWTSSWYGNAQASQVDATTEQVIKTWPEPGGGGSGSSQNPGLTWGFGYAWLVSPPNGDLLKLGSQRNEVGSRGFVGNVPLPPGSQEVAACNGFLWVTSNAGTLKQINPYTGDVVNTYRLGHPSLGVACTRGHIWVSVTNP
jgi:class 3 adenylate cyclase/streptogramin lyase